MQSVRTIIVLLFLSVCAFGAVSFHASASGPNNNGTTNTLTLPTVSNNDLVIAAFNSAALATSNAKPWTTPSGWTEACNVGGMAVFYKRWQTGDATTVAASQQNGAASWNTSQGISYSGVDTTTPVIGANCSTVDGTNDNTRGNALAPAVSPQWTTAWTVHLFFDFSAGAATFTLPGALTARQNTAPGPSIRSGDIASTTGANTGNFYATCTCHALRSGASVVLKPASGGSSVATTHVPTIAGFYSDNSNGVLTFTTALYPQDGDLIVVIEMGCGSSHASISGWNSDAVGSNDFTALSKVWHTGDSTNATKTGGCVSPIGWAFLIRNPNYANDSTAPAFDVVSVTTGTTSTSLVSGSLTLASVNEQAIMFNYRSSGSGTWTAATGTTKTQQNFSNQNFANPVTTQPLSNPTGTFTGTWSTASSSTSGFIAYKIGGATVSRRHRSSVD